VAIILHTFQDKLGFGGLFGHTTLSDGMTYFTYGAVRSKKNDLMGLKNIADSHLKFDQTLFNDAIAPDIKRYGNERAIILPKTKKVQTMQENPLPYFTYLMKDWRGSQYKFLSHNCVHMTASYLTEHDYLNENTRYLQTPYDLYQEVHRMGPRMVEAAIDTACEDKNLKLPVEDFIQNFKKDLYALIKARQSSNIIMNYLKEFLYQDQTFSLLRKVTPIFLEEKDSTQQFLSLLHVLNEAHYHHQQPQHFIADYLQRAFEVCETHLDFKKPTYSNHMQHVRDKVFAARDLQGNHLQIQHYFFGIPEFHKMNKIWKKAIAVLLTPFTFIFATQKNILKLTLELPFTLLEESFQYAADRTRYTTLAFLAKSLHHLFGVIASLVRNVLSPYESVKEWSDENARPARFFSKTLRSQKIGQWLGGIASFVIGTLSFGAVLAYALPVAIPAIIGKIFGSASASSVSAGLAAAESNWLIGNVGARIGAATVSLSEGAAGLAVVASSTAEIAYKLALPAQSLHISKRMQDDIHRNLDEGKVIPITQSTVLRGEVEQRFGFRNQVARRRG
jgi:hypothetical protein